MEISEGLFNAIKGDWKIGKNCAIKYVSGWREDYHYIALDKNGEVIDNHLSDYCDDNQWRETLKGKVADEVIDEIISLRHRHGE